MEGNAKIIPTISVSREQFRRYWANPKLFSVSAEAREHVEKFITDVVDVFYDLRFAAQERFAGSRYLAKDKNQALPLPWSQIKEIICAEEKKTPPKRLVVRIASGCTKFLEAIERSPKRVLRRERRETTLSKIQQIDATCMHNWVRRPGETLIERAGTKQTLLSVVRRENFDVLENRVVKDFAIRADALAVRYLGEFKGKKFCDDRETTKILNGVKRLRALCQKILGNPDFSSVKMPVAPVLPNYTLRENVNYSCVWHFYREILNESAFAENLWLEKDKAEVLLEKLRTSAKKHLPRESAKFYSEIWFNHQCAETSVDTLLENPHWENELGAPKEVFPSKIKILEKENAENSWAIFDLETLPWQTLVESSRHTNAKKYLHEAWQPNSEDFDSVAGTFRAGTKTFSLEEILKGAKEKPPLSREFFEQLEGKLKSRAGRWLILVPDVWDATLLEQILSAVPSREKVFLLWRSVACALGESWSAKSSANKEISIPKSKFFNKPCEYCAEWTTLDSYDKKACAKRVPWRHRRHSKEGVSVEHCCDFDESAHARAFDGAVNFLKTRERGEIAYYDELEGMYLVVQNTEKEAIELKTLVAAEKKFPGGEEFKEEKIDGGKVSKGSTKLKFYLLWTYEEDEDARRALPLKFVETNEYRKDDFTDGSPIIVESRIKPGQGLAQLKISYAPRTPAFSLEYFSLADAEKECSTVNLLDEKLERSFPPISPRDLCDPSFWKEKDFISLYRNKKAGAELNRHKYCFKNGSGWANTLPAVPSNMHPMEFLRWRNVFGNAKRVPANLPLEYQHLTANVPPDDILPANVRDAWFAEMVTDYWKAKRQNDANTVDRIVNWIAWTYSENTIFEEVRNDVYMKVKNAVSGNGFVKPQYFTLCSNLIHDTFRLRSLLKAVRDNWGKKTTNEHALRLCSNILMFHEKIFDDASSEGLNAWENFNQRMVNHITQNDNLRSSGIGYALKTLLFLLRLRMKQKTFLENEKTKEDTNLKHAIASKFSMTTNLEQVDLNMNQKRATAYLKFLSGAGRIADLPAD